MSPFTIHENLGYIKISQLSSNVPHYDDRIAKRLGQTRETMRDHLSKMPKLANSTNTDLSRGFTASLVTEKHACPVGPEDRTGDWTDPIVWTLAVEGREDIARFK